MELVKHETVFQRNMKIHLDDVLFCFYLWLCHIFCKLFSNARIILPPQIYVLKFSVDHSYFYLCIKFENEVKNGKKTVTCHIKILVKTDIIALERDFNRKGHNKIQSILLWFLKNLPMNFLFKLILCRTYFLNRRYFKEWMMMLLKTILFHWLPEEICVNEINTISNLTTLTINYYTRE